MAIVTLMCLTTPTLAQVRDFSAQGRFDPVGTASIAGMIVTDDAQAKPVRRVVVTITEAARVIQPRVVTSDESGGFRFTGLPAGRYTVSATREPYLTGVYGAKRIAGPGSVQTGTVIVVGTGQQVSSITVKLMRSSVITGTVLDADGQPARGFTVYPLHYQRSGTTGERVLVTSGVASQTDDRGVYRIYGLKPGTYLIGANGLTVSDAMVTSEQDVARAMAQLQRPGTPRMGTASPEAGPAQRRRQTGAYVPVYFPGTPDAAQAGSVTVGVAEERGGVDFQMQFVSTARIEGVVIGPEGSLKQSVQVRSIGGGPVAGIQGPQQSRTTSTDDQGRFALSGLAPGTYTLEAELRSTTPTGPLSLWGRTQVDVFGDDRAVSLVLQPTQPLTGRVVFDATTLKPPDVTKVRVSVTSASGGGGSTMSAIPSAAGEFAVTSVKPGSYRLNASLPLPSIETGWYLKSATVNGQEVLDTLLQARSGEAVTGLVITMTDRPTELSGTMTDATNSPAPEYFIVVFAAESGQWTPGSRRIMQTRPSSDGSFVFRNLPPGDYRLAAVTDVQQDEWFDPAFLTQLAAASVPVTIAENGKVRQDIRLR